MIPWILITFVLALLSASLLRFWWPTSEARGLSVGEYQLLRAYCETVLSGVSWGVTVPLPEVMKDAAGSLTALPKHVRYPLRLILWMVERLPGLVMISWRRFSRLPLAQRTQTLQRAAAHPWVLIGSLLELVQSISLITLGGRPEVLAVCQFDRTEQVLECIAARERALRTSKPEGGSS